MKLSPLTNYQAVNFSAGKYQTKRSTAQRPATRPTYSSHDTHIKKFNQQEFQKKMGARQTASQQRRNSSANELYRTIAGVGLTSTIMSAMIFGLLGYNSGNEKGYNNGFEEGKEIGYQEAMEQHEQDLTLKITDSIEESKAELAQEFIDDPMYAISESLNLPLSMLKLANNYKPSGELKENLNLASTNVPHEKTTFPFRVSNEELFIGHPEVRELLGQAQQNLARVFSDGDDFSDNGYIYLTANRDTTMGELKQVFGIVNGALTRAGGNGLGEGEREYIGSTSEKDGAIVRTGDTIKVKVNDTGNKACPGVQFGVFMYHLNPDDDAAQLKAIEECAENDAFVVSYSFD